MSWWATVPAALLLASLVAAAITGAALWLLAAPLAGYGFAWVGHFFFEHNRPATFSHPWYSLAADFVLFRDMLFVAHYDPQHRSNNTSGIAITPSTAYVAAPMSTTDAPARIGCPGGPVM